MIRNTTDLVERWLLPPWQDKRLAFIRCMNGKNTPEELIKIFKGAQTQEDCMDLRGIDLSGETISYARFYMANLDFARLDGCVIFNSSFQGARLNNATFNRSTIDYCSFDMAVAYDSSFDSVRISTSSFSESDLTRSSFRNARIENVDFNGAVLDGVDFSGAVVDRSLDLKS